MWTYDDPMLLDFKELLALGEEYAKVHPRLFEDNIKKGQADDIACLCFTSGTTGTPKASMLSYKTFCYWSISLWKHFTWFEEDDYFSILCPAWTSDQWLGIGTSLMIGAVVNFAESPETVREDGREVASHFHISGARAWEDLYREVQMRIADADIIKRFFYNLFLPVGYKIADLHYQNSEANLFWKAINKVGDWLVFRPLRDKLGLTRARACLVAGAMLSPDLLRYWKAAGVPLFTQYSLTETGYGSMEAPGQMKHGSAGKILPDREIMISEEGEIILKMSPSMFSGYYKNPEGTAEKFKDGWFYTGDSGYIDEEGYLFFIERMSELSALSNGTKFSPTSLEAKLRFSSYLKDAMVIGTEKEFVAALIDIDLGNCGKWAEKRGIVYTTRVDLSQKKDIYDLIRKEIKKVNETIPEETRIKSFINLHKGFDSDEAELTRTRKLKRNVLEDKYKDIIAAIYSPGLNEVEMKTEIKYRDGRTRVLTTKLIIAAVD
jgi:long-chain acyl-CoA synthetase